MTILNNSISRCNEPATGAWRAKDATVVPGQGPRLVVCSREGLGQQLLHVEGTLTAISRTEATRIKLCHPQITCILLSWRRYNVFCLLSVSSCVVYLKITAWSGRNDVFFYSLYWCDCRVMLVPCYIWTPNVPENFTWVNCWSRMSSDRFSDLHADIIVEKKKKVHTHTRTYTEHALTSTKLINLGSYLKWGRPLTQAHWDQFLTLATLKQQVLLH